VITAIIDLTQLSGLGIRQLSFALILAAFLHPVSVAQPIQQRLRIEGVVPDQMRDPILDAEVSLSTKTDITLRTQTDATDRFVLEGVESSGELSVRADGFQTFETTWPTMNQGRLEITLAPYAPHEQVTITASRSRTRLSDTPASVLVLSAEDLSTTAGSRWFYRRVRRALGAI
jgi:hypothetical protein